MNGKTRLSVGGADEMRKNLFEVAATNHKFFDALMEAYKYANIYCRQEMKVVAIKAGMATEYHNGMEEEMEDLMIKQKRAIRKILYANSIETVLDKLYDLNNEETAALMVVDFTSKLDSLVADYLTATN